MRFSLLQQLADIPICVVDTETTGASAALGDKIIEIGVVRLEARRVVARHEQLINPGRPISPGVTALTGITQAMVASQPRFRECLDGFRLLMEGAAIVGHNVRFDLSFLHAEFRRCSMDLGDCLGSIPIFDTLRIALRRFGRGGNSLPMLSRRLGIDPVLSHRALADASTTAAVFETLLEPAGGWGLSLCDALLEQGGSIDLARCAGQQVLPLELEEALDLACPVDMEYVDARGMTTTRTILPLHIRRRSGELILVAHCQLRNDRRTFKVDRIVRMTRVEMTVAAQAMSAPVVEPNGALEAAGALHYNQVDGASIHPARPQVDSQPGADRQASLDSRDL